MIEYSVLVEHSDEIWNGHEQISYHQTNDSLPWRFRNDLISRGIFTPVKCIISIVLFRNSIMDLKDRNVRVSCFTISKANQKYPKVWHPKACSWDCESVDCRLSSGALCVCVWVSCVFLSSYHTWIECIDGMNFIFRISEWAEGSGKNGLWILYIIRVLWSSIYNFLFYLSRMLSMLLTLKQFPVSVNDLFLGSAFVPIKCDKTVFTCRHYGHCPNLT